jgi:hypothetical protein
VARYLCSSAALAANASWLASIDDAGVVRVWSTPQP